MTPIRVTFDLPPAAAIQAGRRYFTIRYAIIGNTDRYLLGRGNAKVY